MSKKILKNDQGRSMVEMLGVLAVVGLLSIMAFAGFRIALNKHYANEILNEGNKRAVIVAGQIGFNQGTPSLSEFANNTFTGGTFDSSVTTNPQTESFALKVSNVPEDVCEQILTMIDEHTMLRRLALEGNMSLGVANCSSSDSSYLLVYNDDLTDNDKQHSCQTDSECDTACGTCQIAEGATKGVCTNECEIIPTTCTTNDECANAGVCAGCVKAEGAETGTCQYACEELEYLKGTGSQYVDTEFKPNNYTTIQGTMSLVRPSTPVYCLWSTEDDIAFGFYLSASPYVNYWLLAYFGRYPDESVPAYGYVNYTKIKLELSPTKVSINSVDNNSYNFSKNITQGTYQSSYNLWLFEGNNLGAPLGGSGAVTIYNFKIWDNAALVRDFIPVLDPDGTPAMLDRVEPKLYYNQGSGEFSYGRKPQP